MPWFLIAATGTVIVSPPQSSGAMPRCCICAFTWSRLAPFTSILLTATISATFAFCACASASSVCGMKPSSAATTSTAMSVTLAPRARILEKAAWPGVSRKVILRPLNSTWYAPMVLRDTAGLASGDLGFADGVEQ